MDNFGFRGSSTTDGYKDVGVGGVDRGGHDDHTLSPGGVLRVIWQRLLLILLVTVLVAGAAVGFSLSRVPVYRSSVELMVGQETSDGAQANLASDIQGLQQLTQTVAEAIESRPIAEAVVRETGLQMTPSGLEERITVEQVYETYFVRVHYEDSVPERAREVADAIGSVFTERISELSPSGDTITATVWEPAVEPRYPVSPNPLRDGLLGIALGLALGVGLAFLLEHLDDSWRSPEELEEASGVPTFGIVPRFKQKKGKK